MTIGGDKGYDTRGFVESLRQLKATPHVARKAKKPGARRTHHTAPQLRYQSARTETHRGSLRHRIHGDRRRATRGIGWEYVHVAVDDHSRIAYVEVLADQFGPTCAAFLRRAVVWFAARGITVRRVLSDNGSGYVSRAFREVCEALGLSHRRTRAYTPRTNGKAERFIQTLLREWAYAVPCATSAERRRQLRRYLAYYNRRRPHASLNYGVPWERLTSAA